MAGARTRRDLLLGGVAAGALPLLLGARDAFADTSGDAEVLAAAIDLEQVAVFTYHTAARSGKLGRATATARLFRDQEQRHADTLIAAQKDLGGRIANKPERVSDVAGLADAARGGAADLLGFAEDLENAIVTSYYKAFAKLKDPKLLTTAGSIMASEAQHVAVLRQMLKQPPSPQALVK